MHHVAAQVRRFVERMPPARTDREWLLFDMLINSHAEPRIFPATV
jgi:hypothetical protein